MKLPIVLSLLVMAMLAGCGDDPTTVVANCQENPGGVGCGPEIRKQDVEAGKGVIRGVVIDETIAPIVDATVTLVNKDKTATTDQNGGFTFVNIEPGTYFMAIEKLGFNSVQQGAEVKAGIIDPPIVKILLSANPAELPFVVSDSYEAFISCGFKTANYVWGASTCDPNGLTGLSASDDADHTFRTGTEQMPQHYQTEITWEASQLLSEGLVTIQCATDNTGCGSGVGSDRMCNVRGPAPLVCAIGINTPSEEVPGGGNNMTTVRDGAGFNGTYTVGLFSNCSVQCDPVYGTLGLGVAIDQKVDIYTNIFYNYSPPADWRFLESGTVPSP